MTAVAGILVPLGDPGDARVAIPVAQTLAAGAAACVRVLHVADCEVAPRTALDRLGLDPEDVRGSVLDVRCGDPAETIVAAAAEPEVARVVLAAREPTDGAGGEPRCRLGPVAARVLREATQPVVVVRPGQLAPGAWRLATVLLPHDGTPKTSAAIRPAVELVKRSGAQLLVLHVAAPGATPPGEPGSIPVPRYLDQAQHEWPAWANEFLQRLASVEQMDLGPLRFLVGHGEPGGEVLRVARERHPDLIVLAWHGSLAGERAAVVKTVLADAPCPVMILRSDSA